MQVVLGVVGKSSKERTNFVECLGTVLGNQNKERRSVEVVQSTDLARSLIGKLGVRAFRLSEKRMAAVLEAACPGIGEREVRNRLHGSKADVVIYNGFDLPGGSTKTPNTGFVTQASMTGESFLVTVTTSKRVASQHNGSVCRGAVLYNGTMADLAYQTRLFWEEVGKFLTSSDGDRARIERDQNRSS